MEIKYQIFEKEKILVQKYTGSFSLELYMRYSAFIMSQPASGFINNVIIDFRDFSFNDIPGDFSETLQRIVEVRKNINRKEKRMENVTVVFWVNKPMPTVIVHMFKSSFSDMDYHYCSTAEHVRELTNAPDRFNDLDDIINNLENTF
ncbi:MAG: hypothetical protein PVF73_09715 [Bacteroidales bacterium]|jgi:hypothetical protein